MTVWISSQPRYDLFDTAAYSAVLRRDPPGHSYRITLRRVSQEIFLPNFQFRASPLVYILSNRCYTVLGVPSVDKDILERGRQV